MRVWGDEMAFSSHSARSVKHLVEETEAHVIVALLLLLLLGLSSGRGLRRLSSSCDGGSGGESLGVGKILLGL